MVSALMCMVTYLIGLMVSHDIGYHIVITSASYYVIRALNLERILS